MPRAKLLSSGLKWLLLVAAAWGPCLESQAAPQWAACAPTEVTTFEGRIHVRCQDPVAPSIVFLALSTADARFAARTLGVGVAAFAAGKGLSVLFDPDDLSGQAIGCLNADCRLIQALGIRDPVLPTPAPSPPAPQEPSEPITSRTQCLEACADERDVCMEGAHSGPERGRCVTAKTQCDRRCPP